MSANQYESLLEAIEDLARRGFMENFMLVEGGLWASGRGRVYRPGELVIVEHHRFEGESNPDDMSVVYAIECRDGVRGIVVDAFGAYASPDLGNFLRNVRDARHAADH